MFGQGDKLTAPFTYFGGKSMIADVVWRYLGDVKHYIEPFFGSGAVLLARSDHRPREHIETVCDADGLLCNVWRALQTDPDGVAKVCDWPVNHADLTARKKRLAAMRDDLLIKLVEDETYYDVKLAGYWIWAASCSIGSGMTSLNQIPEVSGSGKGIHGIGSRPYLSRGSMKINAISQRPRDPRNEGTELKDVRDSYNMSLWTWFRRLSERLRYVRVVCGDWSRVCGGDWQDSSGIVGIFLDPPYSHDSGRCTSVYDQESADVALMVAKWAAERGDRKTHRIVLAGYEGEHDWLEHRGWRVFAWKAQGGYSNTGTQYEANRYRERLWISPHCLSGGVVSGLFTNKEISEMRKVR